MSASLSPGSFGRDEQDWFGGRDQEAEDAASKSLAATAARIVGAKPFPIAAKRLEELTRTATARIEQVVSVLESDPALSARLLRLVNSAGYGLKVRCTSVRHAAVLVGTRRLNQVATTAAILDLFESSNSLAAELLEHAAVVGSLCRYLAVHLGLPHDELFTCGFLHDIGKIMLLDSERDVYPGLLREYGGNADSIHEAERRVFGFDHATLGAHVLTAWNIPEPVPKVIAWHHQPARALQDSLLSAMVQTLRLADLLAYELGRRNEQEGIQLVAQSEAARYLDISEPQLAAMWQDLAGLRERSRARSHGEAELEAADPRQEVPNSLRPRGSLSPRSKSSVAPTRGSLLPIDSEPPGSIRPVSDQVPKDVPKKLACVVCGTGSYGNVCQACGGHVCPNHQTGADEWCSLCEDEFGEFKTTYRLPPSLLTGAAAVVILSLLGAVASAWSAGNTGFSALLAPLLLSVVWGLVLPIAAKLWIKLRFMRGLSPRTPPQASIDTDGEHLKPEGRERMSLAGDGQLPLTPSVVPEYERTTAPPIEPFAAGLLGLRPPADSLLRLAEPRATEPPSSEPGSSAAGSSVPRASEPLRAEASGSEPPPSARGPVVIRVEVPKFSTSSLPVADGQLSAMARLAQPSAPPEAEADSQRELASDSERAVAADSERDVAADSERELASDSERGHISSVMPTALADASTPSTPRPARLPSVPVPAAEPFPLAPSTRPAAALEPAPVGVRVPSSVELAPSEPPTPSEPSEEPAASVKPAASVAPTPSPTPSSEPMASVQPTPVPVAPLVTPAPVLIPLSPPPVLSEPAPAAPKVLTMQRASVPPKPVEISSAPAEEQSGVYQRALNVPGVLREVCSPVVYNRCS